MVNLIVDYILAGNMLKRKIDVYIKDKSVRTYIVLKVLKEDESMIRFVGTDTRGEVALVTAEKSDAGKYEVAGSFDIPIFVINNDDDWRGNKMILDVEKIGYLVRTPDGPGIIEVVEQDIRSLQSCAVVRLEKDKSVRSYTEEQLEAITTEPKKEKCTGLVKDSDVIKALECCQLSNTHQEKDCNNCPFNELPQTICQNLLAYHALQIIKKGAVWH